MDKFKSEIIFLSSLFLITIGGIFLLLWFGNDNNEYTEYDRRNNRPKHSTSSSVVKLSISIPSLVLGSVLLFYYNINYHFNRKPYKSFLGKSIYTN